MTRTSWPPGHTIHMSLEETPEKAVSLARCDCGWDHRANFSSDRALRFQDDAVERHWRQVEAAR